MDQVDAAFAPARAVKAQEQGRVGIVGMEVRRAPRPHDQARLSARSVRPPRQPLNARKREFGVAEIVTAPPVIAACFFGSRYIPNSLPAALAQDD